MADINSIKQLAKKHGWDLRMIEMAVAQIGGSSDKLLGCGAIGCTFEGPGEKGKAVLKLTSDQSEFDLWVSMLQMQETKHGTVEGVPEVFDAGTIEGVGGDKPALYVIRESVEPMVMGSTMNVGPRTRRFLFGELAEELAEKLPMKEDWSFVSLAMRLADEGLGVTDAMLLRCQEFDEDLRKLYDLTSVTDLAEHQPSIRDSVWRKAYAATARSTREPFTGIGNMVASILEETGSTWVTDLHMGNLGWRLQPEPQMLAYDWLASDLRANGKLV